MKVLVTGATGFVGRHVTPLLLERGHDVTVLVRDSVKAQTFSWHSHVHVITGDIHHSEASLAQKIGKQDAIIHLAWSGLPNYKELFHFEENLPLDYRFLKSIIENGIGHLLVTGTCLEYGMRNGCLLEEFPANPSNPYALAKDTLRKFLVELKKKHSYRLEWARLFYLYGPGQNPNSLLSQLDRAVESKEEIFNMSGGEQVRDYLPVEEAARRLVTLLEHPACEGVVNICSGTPISVRNLVELHLQKKNAHIKLNLGYYPYPDYEPMSFWGSTEKYMKYCSVSETGRPV